MVVLFSMFAVWTPEVWLELPYHYRVGQLTARIGGWDIERFAHRQVAELRLEIGLEAAHEAARAEFLGGFARIALPSRG